MYFHGCKCFENGLPYFCRYILLIPRTLSFLFFSKKYFGEFRKEVRAGFLPTHDYQQTTGWEGWAGCYVPPPYRDCLLFFSEKCLHLWGHITILWVENWYSPLGTWRQDGNPPPGRENGMTSLKMWLGLQPLHPMLITPRSPDSFVVYYESLKWELKTNWLFIMNR